jgi:hypothetical protein
MTVLVNTYTGQSGSYADWVRRFEEIWEGGCHCVGNFMSLFGEDVTLTAPGLRTTRGRAACEQAFVRTFEVLPDLSASVQRWSGGGDCLFIEMTFGATIGGRWTIWSNVDRFVFRDGVAIERRAFFNPLKPRRAFLANPRGWLQLFKRLRTGL